MKQAEAKLHNALVSEISHFTKVTETEPGKLLVSTAWRDNLGDPIRLMVICGKDGEWTSVDDAGTVAGHLFSSGEDAEQSPGYRLTMELVKTHGAQVDYGQGTLVINNKGQHLVEAITTLTKIVTTAVTALPHLKVIQDEEAIG